MAKKKSVEVGTARCAVRAPSGRKIPAAIPPGTLRRDVPTTYAKPSALVDARVIKADHAVIIPPTLKEILDGQIARKLV